MEGTFVRTAEWWSEGGGGLDTNIHLNTTFYPHPLISSHSKQRPPAWPPEIKSKMLKLRQNILFHLGIIFSVGINFRFPSGLLLSSDSLPPSQNSPHSTFLWMQLWPHLPPPPLYTPPPPSYAGPSPGNWPESKVRQAPYWEQGEDWKIGTLLIHLNPVKHRNSITHVVSPAPVWDHLSAICWAGDRLLRLRKRQSNDHWLLSQVLILQAMSGPCSSVCCR